MFSPKDDEVFDVDEFEGDLDSEATSVEDLNVDDDPDLEIDFKDQIQLFSGNVQPPRVLPAGSKGVQQERL